MTSFLSTIAGSSKRALIFISLIVVVTIVDSQLINAFYATNLATPSNYHLLLFISLVIVASVINAILILFAKRNDIQAKTSWSSLFIVSSVHNSRAFNTCNLLGNDVKRSIFLSIGYHFSINQIRSNLLEGLGIEVTISRTRTTKNKSKVNTATIEIRKIPPMSPMPPVTENHEGNNSKTAGDFSSTGDIIPPASEMPPVENRQNHQTYHKTGNDYN